MALSIPQQGQGQAVNKAVDLARWPQEAHMANKQTVVKFWFEEEKGVSQMLVNHLQCLGFAASEAVVECAKKSCKTSIGQSPSNKKNAQRQRLEHFKTTTHQVAVKNSATIEGTNLEPIQVPDDW